jgi:hypothetical protein
MKTVIAGQLKVTLGWTLSLVDQLEGEEWLHILPGTHNHGWWLFGHLVESMDFPYFLGGEASRYPEKWEEMFGLGSSPRSDGAGYPSVGELHSALEGMKPVALEFLSGLDDTALAAPPGSPTLAKHFPTAERFLLFQPIHMGYHLGQFRSIVTALHGSTGSP